ncbi:putative reverse transcriptase domain-containing protein [Tanacetum coccineum]|uniref:Reverse transcriptase domain-containing protein n=1 Tax=Tanacetum coccineum TaxID=301880 RepID=A0ABQ5GCR2_9ASTR
MDSKPTNELGPTNQSSNTNDLFKWIWRFRCQSNDLWEKVIKSLYVINGGINDDRALSHSTWGAILSSVKRLKQHCIDLLDLCARKIRNGALTSFWNDSWSGNIPLKTLFPGIYMLDSDKGSTVSHRLNIRDWSFILRRLPRGGEESSQFNALISFIRDVVLSDQKDTWEWSLNTSIGFTVTSVRTLIDANTLVVDSNATRWGEFGKGKALTLTRLCALFVVKMLKPLIIFSSLARWLRIYGRYWLVGGVLTFLFVLIFLDWSSWLDSLHLSSKVKLFLEGVEGTLLWTIWNFRNRLHPVISVTHFLSRILVDFHSLKHPNVTIPLLPDFGVLQMVPEPRIMPPRRFKKKSVRKIVEKRVAKAIEKYEKTRADSNNTGGSGSTNTRGTVYLRCMEGGKIMLKITKNCKSVQLTSSWTVSSKVPEMPKIWSHGEGLEKGHFKDKCPKAGNQQNDRARRRAYVVVENPQQNPNVVTGASPIVRSPNRLAPSRNVLELSNSLKNFQEKGFIRPSHSPWGAPVLFVKKKDGKKGPKPRRVRAMSITIHSGLKTKILEAQSEASKDLKAPTEWLRGLETHFEQRDDGEIYFFDRIWILSIGVGCGRKLNHDESFILSRYFSNIRTEKLGKDYTNEIVARHGVPVSIILDRDGRFTSHLCQAFQEELGTRLDMKHVGRVAYRLKLPQELSCVHDTFHVSNLKKCLAEPDVQVPLDEIEIDENLQFVKEPIKIVERDVKKLKRRRIPLVKVRWNSRQGAEYTWEREDQFQKKYPNLFSEPVLSSIGDKVMLKVSPWKGVIRFGKRGRLNPRYVGPFKVLEKVGEVAYKLELPEELSRVHNTFHVSNLKKCHADEPLVVPLDGLHLDDKLHFVEKPVEIMDREVKRLKRSRILLVKVRWNSKRGPEFTWEREDQFRKKYPHLFAKTAPSSSAAS